MIKCPNCGAANLDGTLFCDQCIWDLTGVEPEPDAAPAAAPMAEALPAEAMPMEAMALEAPPAEAMPMEAEYAEAMPMEAAEAMPMEAAEAMPMEAYEAPPEAEFPDAGLEAPAMETPAAEAEPVQAAEQTFDVGAPDADVMPIGEHGYPVSGVIPAEAVSQVLPGSEPELEVPPEPAPAAESAPAEPAAAPAPVPLSPSLPLTRPPRLVVVRGVKTNIEYQLTEGANYIGRFDEQPVDIDLSDQEPSDKVWTSRQHACVTWDIGGVVIEDLHSSNGTYINRNKISGGEKRPLRNGDYVQVGAVLFQVKM